MQGSTDRDYGSIDRDVNSANFNFGPTVHKPIKLLGFQIYFTSYLKETLRHVCEDFGSALVRSKRCCVFSFQSHYQKSFSYH